MAEQPSIKVVREIVAQARQLTDQRAAEETRIAAAWEGTAGAAQRAHTRAVRSIHERRDAELKAAAAARDSAIEQARARFDAVAGATQREYDAKRGVVMEAAAHRLDEIEREAQEAQWLAGSLLESDSEQAEQRARRAAERLASQQHTTEALESYAQQSLSKIGLWRPGPDERIDRQSAGPCAGSDADEFEHAVEVEAERAFAAQQARDNSASAAPADDSPGAIGAAISAELDAAASERAKKEPSRVEVALESARNAMEAIERSAVVRIARWPVVIGVAALLAACGGVVGWLADGQAVGTLTKALGGAGAALGVGAASALRVAGRKAVRTGYATFVRSMEDAWFGLAVERRLAEIVRVRSLEMIRERHTREMAQARTRSQESRAKAEAKRDERLAMLEQTYMPRLRGAQEERDAAIAAAQAAYVSRERLCLEVSTADEREQERRFQAIAGEAQAVRDRDWKAMESAWRTGMEAMHARAAAIGMNGDRAALPWADSAWESWSPAVGAAVGAARFGSMTLDLRALSGGLSEDPALRVPGPDVLELPVALAVPDAASLLIQFGREGREAALDVLRSVMLRQLVVLPPGKVRFTIIDPVGLGQSFAGFMHLADYNEAAVAYRIWTEAKHIEQRLAELTEHMENVIQKYLRNQFESIAQYNREAGEIAEPYRFLVISDFPVNFSDATARRLMSIIQSGARCGVYTLIAMDLREKVPGGLDVADMEAAAATLVYKDGRFGWKDPVFTGLPLALDPPPSEALLTQLVKRVGEASIDGSRVEVPFDAVMPPEGRLWSGDSGEELRVPLGRAGATKLQQMVLGRGTAQHVLLAGKTGSGKSTLLNVMITNLALWYGPDQVEFYLVDFKKGVEFKAYATRSMPHARAVAIESDREFGLSVLQRVDDELKRRGDLFRAAGVQNLAGFREARPDVPMPRTLLIIDEFQEMFVEEDKLAQAAALLLDRLVRQGRAFGIHVILGSQTLGGAYGLARSTLGQMAVRIALQCSEADSYLIMSEDNAAARLLSRPGEAIYNDAAGMIEGNSPFQIVWLPDERRDAALRQIEALAEAHGVVPAEPTIVFEGNVPADLERNPLLARSAEASHGAARTGAAGNPVAPQAWLGDAIAIKDPTAATLRRQSGANVLMIGQNADAMLGIVSGAMVSLAAQHAPGTAQFYAFDATPEDDPSAGSLGRVAQIIPHDARVVPLREVDATLLSIAEEVDRRAADQDFDSPAVYVTVFGLQRMRSLRSSGDDFGFSMSDEAETPKPDKLLAKIVREGPAVGVHVLLWCDTLANLERSQDRRVTREFDHRVLLQMSGSDSTSLIDSPAAWRLGPGRGLYYNEESGVLEKFRPYALPDAGVLERLRAVLRGAPVGG